MQILRGGGVGGGGKEAGRKRGRERGRNPCSSCTSAFHIILSLNKKYILNHDVNKYSFLCLPPNTE